MIIDWHLRKIKEKISLIIFKLHNIGKEKFECPICRYKGPFMDVNVATGLRKHAKCPCCGALERHRLQFLVIKKILNEISTTNLRMLHFAPEPFFQEYFSKRFGRYETADLNMKGVDYNVDLQQLPFDDESYDFVFASHVLEHIPDDEKAISEIRRILRPNGIAVLPVPIVTEKTIEYPAPNPYESFHVRAPGFDYFEKYKRHFWKVELFRSDSFSTKYQLFIFENRERWPTKECPLRPPMKGEKHIDIVPVCYA